MKQRWENGNKMHSLKKAKIFKVFLINHAYRLIFKKAKKDKKTLYLITQSDIILLIKLKLFKANLIFDPVVKPVLMYMKYEDTNSVSRLKVLYKIFYQSKRFFFVLSEYGGILLSAIYISTDLADICASS